MSERTSKDYAIEFGEYLAKAAEHYVEMINKHSLTRLGFSDEIGDAYQSLNSAIYEFRKRAARS